MTRQYRLVSLLLLFIAPQTGGFAPHIRQQQLLQQHRPSLGTTCSQSFPNTNSFAPCHESREVQSISQSSFSLAASFNDGKDEITKEAPLVSKTNRRRSWRKRMRRWMLSVAVGTSLFRSTPANAKFSYELRETPTSSLRPGITREQAEKVEEGEIDGRSIQAKTALAPEPEKPAAPKKTPTKQSSYYDDLDDEDEGDFLEEEVVGNVASKADQTAAKRLQSRSNFAAYQQGKSKALTVKVGVAFFVPTYGSLIVREYFRRRKEEAYVQKGLEILEAQKAEYFNVTGTSADSDVQDALKNLKKNETKADDDDDDDDDDDEDDDDDDDDEEDNRPRGRRGPRRPPGDGSGGGGDDGGSSGSGDGRGRPSDEDLDKLDQMFRRS